MKVVSVPFCLWLTVALLVSSSALAQNDVPAPPKSGAPETAADPNSGTDSSNESKKSPAEADKDNRSLKSMIILVIGIGTVLGLIIILKVNAFLALITAALTVSFLTVPLLEGGKGWSGAVGRVAKGFGDTVTGIGIVRRDENDAKKVSTRHHRDRTRRGVR